MMTTSGQTKKSRAPKSEGSLQDQCLAELFRRGHYRINVYGSGRSAKGAPDILSCINGLFVAFELKVKNNKPDEAQILHERRIKRSGGIHYYIYTFDEFTKALEEVGG